MKLRKLLNDYFRKSDRIPASKANLYELEQNILTMLPVQPKSMKNTISFSIVSLCALVAIVVGIYSVINKASVVPLAPPVSAAELLNRVEKKLGKQFSYTQKTADICSADEKDYAYLFQNESGAYEDDPLTRKRIAECQKNNGKLYFTSTVWVDQAQKKARIDTEIGDWQVMSYKDKKGRQRMSTINPTNILHDDTVYSFYALAESMSPGAARPGVYVKLNKTDNEVPRIKEQMKTPQERIAEAIEKNKDAENFKVTFGTVKENGKEYYRLVFSAAQITEPPGGGHPIKTGEYKKYSEQYFEKDTYRPIKMIYYDDKGSVFSETTYENFTQIVDDNVFDTTNPPKGYSFLKGSVSSVDVNRACTSCFYGDPMEYRISALTFKDASGKDLDIPGMGAGLVLMPINLKVYESRERFATEQEAKDADKLSYEELKSFVPKEALGLLNDLYFYSNAKIGTNKPYSSLKIEVYDDKGKKLRDLFQTGIIAYDSERLPDFGKLRFQNLEKNDVVRMASYGWREDKTILIQFQRPVLDVNMCSGYRDDKECIQTKDGDISQANVSLKQPVEGHADKKSWWRTDLIYKGTYVTIQFNGFNDNLSDAQKKEVVADVKKLIKKLDSEWK